MGVLITLCACGCGERVTPGRRFRRGHNVRGAERSLEYRANISASKTGANHPNFGKRGPETTGFKAGKTTHRGYVYVLVDETHPYFCMARKGGRFSSYISEHRLVMAQHLGRVLMPGENVHHKLPCEGGSGDTSDNRIENLTLFASRADHSIHHWNLEKQMEKQRGWKGYAYV